MGKILEGTCGIRQAKFPLMSFPGQYIFLTKDKVPIQCHCFPLWGVSVPIPLDSPLSHGPPVALARPVGLTRGASLVRLLQKPN